jgi:hypothetical protein
LPAELNDRLQDDVAWCDFVRAARTARGAGTPKGRSPDTHTSVERKRSADAPSSPSRPNSARVLLIDPGRPGRDT